ncbi:MAG: UDP-N-acetylglucosamine 1-carboxyvinyltransferase [Parcubacteria group bacterium]|nr:UDP-N-acetylglucosamine 1-carboxyvinyltransferase [Parcubacteria group bacterium]
MDGEKFIIRGGKKLSGEIRVQGSKNAALPVLAATLLVQETCSLSNIPLIRDVGTILEIFKSLGSKITWTSGDLTIDNSDISNFAPQSDYVRLLRGSVLLLGPLLARFGEVLMPYPGGDAIGARSIDSHLEGFRALGADVSVGEDHFLKIKAPRLASGKPKLIGAKIVLSESSVTTTENLMLAAVLAEGETRLRLCAAEPHVQNLALFLNKMGAKINGAGTPSIDIKGVVRLKGVEHKIISDSDEAMNLTLLGAASRSDFYIRDINPDFLEAGIQKLKEIGVALEIGNDFLRLKPPSSIYQSFKIQSGLYPKLLTDQIPPFSVLATQAQGTSLIHEWMYEGRLGYINELIKMGANAVIMDPHRALIVGPTPFHGAELKSLDVRAGMTSIIAALVAEGESILYDAFNIDRGFEKLDERLRKLGADITRM